MSQAEHLGYGDEALILRTIGGRVLDWNKAAELLYGYSREEAVGKTTHELFSTKFPEPLTKINKAITETGHWKGGLVRTLRNGREIIVNSRWISDDGEGPEPVVLEIDIDKTASVQSDRLVRQKEQVLFQILDSVPDGVFVLSADGTPYYANRKARDILGKGIEEKGTRSGFAETYSAFVAGTDIPYPEQNLPLVRALQGESVSIEDLEIHRPGGKTLELHSAGAPVYDLDGRLVFACATFSDITDLKEVQRKLIDTNKLLKQSNGELENYSYAVSHDLKTPLRTIKSFSTFLIEDYSESLNPTALDYLNRIAKAAKRMDDLIDGLLTLSRVGRKFNEVEDVDLNELVAEIVLDVKGRWRTGEVVVNGRLPRIRIQRVWMKQLMMNLVTNGLKYNKAQNPTVEVSCTKKDDEYLFSFKDNGIGIDPRYQDKLFGLFQRLHTADEYEGSGIGLATCKKVVENFGGTIWLDSSPGKGTTFFFTVPASGGPP
jgi:PAS domain S-box-containing protein